MPVALPEEIFKELVLKMRRRGILQQLKHTLGPQPLGMQEHGQVQEANRIL